MNRGSDELSPDEVGLVARWRASARADDERRARRAGELVDRVLAATTRADAPRRRPTLVEAFRERWPRSLAFRVLAASLLVHVAALPILGWYAFRDPEPDVEIVFELPREDEFRAEEEAELAELSDLELAEVEELLDELPGSRWTASEHDNARRRARFRLHTAGAPGRLEVAPTSVRGRVLAARAEGIAAGAWGRVPAASEVREDGVARALLAETLLDRAVLEGDREGLRPVLELLEPEVGPMATRELEREAARRALALGLAGEDLRTRWHADRWLERDEDLWADPLTERWFALLELATADGSRDPVVRGWLRWGAR